MHITGAPFSQAQILHLMKTEFSRARRYGYPLSVVLMRVDRIQSMVEIHGPVVRDAIKTVLGRVVAEKTRDHDHVGLLSEDRYLLVLPHAGPREAALVGERIRGAFADADVSVAGQPIAPTLSLGVAACEDRETLFFDTLVSQAEIALDDVSRVGGDAVRTFVRERFVQPDDVSGAGPAGS